VTIAWVALALAAFAFAETFLQARLERWSYTKHFED
jgi:hypothetical protein